MTARPAPTASAKRSVSSAIRVRTTGGTRIGKLTVFPAATASWMTSATDARTEAPSSLAENDLWNYGNVIKLR